MSHLRINSYRKHRASGQAVVTLGGRDFYLGAYGSPESWAEYQRLTTEFVASGGVVRPKKEDGPTVNELVDCYLAFAESYYRKGDKLSSQYERVERSLQFALDLYGDLAAAEFSPLRLQAVRQQMIERGWKRKFVNACVDCIKRAWKWAVSQEMVGAEVYQALACVEGLRLGRTPAPESSPVLPVPEKSIEAVLPLVAPQVSAMIDLQLQTGMRPGEVVQLRPMDIDRSGKADLGFGPIDVPGCWVYRPASHKLEHLGRGKVILLGPKAQAVLAPWLLRPADAHCFSPAEAEAARSVERRDARQSPLWPSHVERQRRKKPRRRTRPPGDSYTVASYSRAIARACETAGVTAWTTHRLRHNAATRIGEEFGLEIAQHVLGHSSPVTTKLYAARALQKAADAMRQSG